MTDLAVKRPVLVSMVFLFIIMFSVYAVLHLPLTLLPNLSYPRLSIISYWRNANPEEVEAELTSRIENIAGSMTGLRGISSVSSKSRSIVNLEFSRRTDMDYTRFELNEKLQLLKGKLPSEVVPEIAEYTPREFRDTEFLQYGFSGPFQTGELEELINRHLRYPISSFEGVAGLTIKGVEKMYILISVRNEGISCSRLRKIIKLSGKKYPDPVIKMKGKNLLISIRSSLCSLDDLKELVFRDDNGRLVRLTDIAKIEVYFRESRELMRYNGLPQVTLTIEKKEEVNTLELASCITELVKKRTAEFPDMVKVIKMEDESETIRRNLGLIYKRGIFSILMIFLVMMVFLKKAGSSIMVLTSIFLSTALTFGLMYIFGIGLNMLSLAGLVLGSGMMVDNSIVVYESIHKYMNRGLGNMEASYRGTKEVSLPVKASTMTTMIVFAPFLYIQGDLQIFYLPFALTTILSLVSSLLVSFSLIPLFTTHCCNDSHRKAVCKINRRTRVHDRYQKVIKFLIRNRWIWTGFVLLIFILIVHIYNTGVDKGMVWNFPRDDFISIQISLPVGSNMEQTDEIVTLFEKQVLDERLVESVKTRIWPSYAYIKVEFDQEVRSTTKPVIMRERLKAFAQNFGNCRIIVSGFGPGFGGGGFSTANFSLELRGYNYLRLKETASELEKYMVRIDPRISDVDINAAGWWKRNRLYEYVLIPDRGKMSRYKVNISDLIEVIRYKLENTSEILTSTFDGEKTSILIKEKGFDEFSVTDLVNLKVENTRGSEVKVTEMAELEKVEIMPEIQRENELYTRRINFDYQGSYKKGKKSLEFIKQSFPFQEGYYIEEEDENRENKQETRQLLYLIISAVILVYMTLSALFESLKYPLIILFSLPLAFIGVTLIFHFSKETFGTAARIGLVLLAGIVVNNSIIMVDQINLLRKKGMTVSASILQAVRERSRPILMTSLTTITALIPMLFKSDPEGSGFWRLLALSTIGGLTTSTFFVLTFIPILYYLFSGGSGSVIRQSPVSG